MFSRRIWQIVLPAVMVLSPFAFGFDPFTAAAVVGAGANAVSVVSETAGEVAASADAIGELYNEIDAEAGVGEDGQYLIREIHEIEALAQEAGYTKEELEDLTSDSANATNAKKLSATLKTITRAIRAGKRVARLAMKLDQKAKLAQVETVQIEREQLSVLYKQLRLEHEQELRKVKDGLKELKEKRNEITILKNEEKKDGAQVFGRTGALTFPKQEVVIEEAIKLAITMRPLLFSLILFVFLLRTVFYQFGFYDVPKYGDLIRDAVVCSVMLVVFPELARACMSICSDFAGQIGLKELRDVEPGSLDFPAKIGFAIKSRLFLEWLFQWIKYIAFVVARFLANFGLSFLVLLFPIVIFCSQMLNFSIAWPIFLGGFIAVCLWPLFWNATGMLAVQIWRKQDIRFSDQVVTVLLSLLQFFSPLLGIAALKGQPLAKTAARAGRAAAGLLSSGSSAIANQATGFVKGALGIGDQGRGGGGSRNGGTLGRTLAYPVNQVANRMKAAGSRGIEAAQAAKAHADDHHWADGRRPAVGGALKAAAHGFVMNQAQGSHREGSRGGLRQVLNGLKPKRVLEKGIGAEPRADVLRGPAKKSGVKNV